MRIGAVCLAVAFGVGVLTSCGEQPSAPAPQTGAAPAEQHLVLDRGADSPLAVAVHGDAVLVLTTSDDGVVRSQFSDDGGPFRPGEELVTGVRWAMLDDPVRLADGAWYALGTGGVERRGGDEELVHEPFAVRSDDGLVWERVEVTGFARPADVNDLVVHDQQLLAVGAYRTADDPSMGGFTAQAWSSTDGSTYAEVDLPDVPDYRGYRTESAVGDAVTTGSTIVLGGQVGPHAAIWTSDDGETWRASDDSDLAAAQRVVGLDATTNGPVLATVVGGDRRVVRSDDAGLSWRPVAGLGAADEEDWAPLWRAGDRFLTWQAAAGGEPDWFSPEVCYADLRQCGAQPPPVVVAGEGDGAWRPVALGASDELDAVVGTADGRVLALGTTARGVRVRTWTSWGEVPDASSVAEPETVQVTMLAEGEAPEMGTTYAHPLNTHCGIERVWFADSTWRRTDDGARTWPEAWSGAPRGWPVPKRDGIPSGSVYGFATLEADGSMTYTDADGAVLATYQRAARPFYCD
ncbi:sialidase/neuraminidase family protein [Nocardioides sambongensis]|uniref:hypothetical protein n=1 Tax=Nocardioides sambongensis TaxID=2589074 RepID=UPI0011290C39|nr:hypothetical protein [Nocardioides sambongensis]